jgi:hypothetical protein
MTLAELLDWWNASGVQLIRSEDCSIGLSNEDVERLCPSPAIMRAISFSTASSSSALSVSINWCTASMSCCLTRRMPGSGYGRLRVLGVDELLAGREKFACGIEAVGGLGILLGRKGSADAEQDE